MYIEPKIIVMSTDELNKHISAAARSMCDGDSKNFVVGAGCGYGYTNGSCDKSHNCDAMHYFK